jgi:hypothetical protein
MTHGYCLRPNTKGRRRHNQVEGTSTGSASEEGQKPLTDELEDESGTVDPRPATPDTPRTAHNSPKHSRSIITSSVISATTTRYRIEGRRPEETREEIQAARKREEARRIAEAVRIRRVQIGHGYTEELRALQARVVALRRECEVKVERAGRKWERDWAIERGEVGVVVEEDGDGDGGEEGNLVGSDSQDAGGGEMAVDDKNYAPTERSSLGTNKNGDHLLQSCWSRSESNFPPPPPPTRPPRQRTQHQQHLSLSQRQQEDESERGPGPAGEAHTSGRRLPRNRNHPPSRGRRKSQHSRSRPEHPQPQPQPLRRQSAQLMVIPTSSHGLHTYCTEPEIRFGGTDGDNDSEIDGCD